MLIDDESGSTHRPASVPSPTSGPPRAHPHAPAGPARPAPPPDRGIPGVLEDCEALPASAVRATGVLNQEC